MSRATSNLDDTMPSAPLHSGASRRRRRRGRAGTRLGAGLLSLVMTIGAWGMRLAGWLLAIAVICAGVLTGPRRLTAQLALAHFDVLLPASMRGLLVHETPLGGVFRGDLALMACALFVIDWLLLRTAYRLRKDEKGRR